MHPSAMLSREETAPPARRKSTVRLDKKKHTLAAKLAPGKGDPDADEAEASLRGQPLSSLRKKSVTRKRGYKGGIA